ncbi:uncharacterized protein CMC5_063270 [Chondromyces crocatus]|uniref:LTD domain-containing protein n=2 Tax=Chondromyces crocatus TaxID=52 RepID=A0A0K1ENE2_CHOCO|nr:uncharacterized protein CMC5_063270 [Chondromyces crocatus]
MLERALIATLLATTLAFVGCSDDSGSTTGGNTVTDTITNTSTNTDTDTDTDTDTGGPGSGAVVINEVSATPKAIPYGDWVELHNGGDTPFNLSGYGLADTDNTSGGPKLGGKELRFPQGTVIEPGAFLLVIADQDIANGPGPHTTCGSHAATCFYAEWGATDDGESIYLVDGNDDIVDQTTYPSLGTDGTQTWGRLPDATGDFALTSPTPGASNGAP